MESLVIHGTKKTPEVHCDGRKGFIEIKGRSIPEDPYEFYIPIINWLEKYKDSEAAMTQVNVQLDYFNTSSSKFILDLFKKLEAIAKKHDVIINWYYEEDDDEMFDAGKNFEALIFVSFKMIKIPVK